LPSGAVALSVSELSAEDLLASLRGGDPAIIARVEDGRVLLDLRTVFPAEEAEIVSSLRRITG
jgi:L-seryl-tRNA(Ser) seleniumtransferase